MSHSVAAPLAGAPALEIPTLEIPTVDLRELAPWALLFGLVATLVLFFVSTDQGAVSLLAGTGVHEWVHDGRHLLGYPCH